ncbi:MAG: hypothetical protein OEV94_03915 [Deltaproteobacteria bacterium]|nr:hypothetical protein [Deltaproteobacteria bacterium]
MKTIGGIWGLLLAVGLFPALAWGQETEPPVEQVSAPTGDLTWVPDRRRNQFYRQFGYFAVPAPYNIEGVGGGVVVGGSVSNIADSTTDVALAGFTGAMTGWAAMVTEYHIVEERLLLDVIGNRWNRLTVNVYPDRGMASGAKDYQIAGVREMDFTGARTTLTFWERRLEFFLSYSTFQMSMSKMMDNQGVLIADLTGTPPHKSISGAMGLFADFTDDYQDPRKGFRFFLGNYHHPRQNPDAPVFYIVDANLTGYVSVGEQSTWVVNLFQSQANVISLGLTDLAALANQTGCPGQQPACMGLANNTLLANQHGTATSLGGLSRLRAYPINRFNGGATAFAGTELRFNFSGDPEPIDIFIMKDVKMALQWALFCETGSVAETADRLWKRSRTDCGTGVRMVGGSGLVYRMDYAVGDEGGGLVMLVGYPWENL